MSAGLDAAIAEMRRVREYQEQSEREERQRAEAVERICSHIAERFRTFGGGLDVTEDSPIAHALKDRPLTFAAGVKVQSVVEFVLREVGK